MVAASEVLRNVPEDAYSWFGDATNPPATLIVNASKGGFPVEMLCETYGLYPKILGWHGAPWDVTVFHPGPLAEQTKEFLRSVLSTVSSLEVHCSNGKPYKHVLHVMFDGELIADTQSTCFYNWFGAKAAEVRQNDWLAPE